MSKLSLDDCTCTVCMHIFVEPVTMPCGHELCLECFRTNVEQTSLVCPLCRKRIASWARRCARNNKLVNQKRWAEIQQAWPDKVRKRLGGEEDSSSEDEALPQAFYSLAQPGEIHQEYEKELLKIEAERSERYQKEEEASRKLIEQLQREEQGLMQQLSQRHVQQQEEDARLAEELNKELNEKGMMSPEVNTFLNNRRVKTPTFMDKFLKKTRTPIRIERGAGDPDCFPYQFLSPWEKDQGNTPETMSLTTNPEASILVGVNDCESDDEVTVVASISGQTNGKSTADGDDTLVYVVGEEDGENVEVRRVVDMCASANKVDETVMFAGDVSQDSLLTDLEPRMVSSAATSVSSIGAPDWSFCEIEKPDSDIFVMGDSRASSVKYTDRQAEIDPLDLLKELSAEASVSPAVDTTPEDLVDDSSPDPIPSTSGFSLLNEASNDSISIELVHFRPIRKCPRTPPRRLAGGKAQNPPLVLTKPRNPSAQGVERKGWGLNDPPSPIMQRRLLELSAERQAQVEALSKGTCTGSGSAWKGKSKKSASLSSVDQLPSPSKKVVPTLPMLTESDSDDSDASEPLVPLEPKPKSPTHNRSKPARTSSDHPEKPARCGSGPFKTSPGKVYLMRTSTEQTRKASDFLAGNSSPPHRKSPRRNLLLHSFKPQTSSEKRNLCGEEWDDGGEKELGKKSEAEGSEEEKHNGKPHRSVTQKGSDNDCGKSTDTGARSKAKLSKRKSLRVRMSRYAFCSRESDTDRSLVNKDSPGKRKRLSRSKESPAKNSENKEQVAPKKHMDRGYKNGRSRSGGRSPSQENGRSSSTLQERDTCPSNPKEEDMEDSIVFIGREDKENSKGAVSLDSGVSDECETPKKKSRGKKLSDSESRSRSREGSRAIRRSPRRAKRDAVSPEQQAAKPKSRRRKRVEYSPTDDGKTLSHFRGRPMHVRRPKYKVVEYSPSDAGKKASVKRGPGPKRVHQTKLQFVENSDDDFEMESRPNRKGKLVLSRSSGREACSHHRPSSSKAAAAAAAASFSKHRVKHKPPKSVSSATCSTTDSDCEDSFFPRAQSSSTTFELEDPQRQRSDFGTDAEYGAYLEQQDFLLAQQLQADFDAEAKYQLNSIRRKGTPDEYQLRNKAMDYKAMY